MWRRAGTAILLAALLALDAAAPAAGASAPRFTLAEEGIIARNAALIALLPLDPSGVRTILDALATAEEPRAASRRLAPPTKTHRDILGGVGDGTPIRIDPARNPDLGLLFQRASPEAAYDLSQILKRVAGGKAGVQLAPAGGGR
jgi:hypothetical protein